MSDKSDFSKLVLRACEQALVEAGFRKLRQQSVVYDLSSDFLGWVGLNYGCENDVGDVRINPFVGIHCIPLMRMIEELSGSKYQIGRYATFAVHLAEIDSSVGAFTFSLGDDIEKKARDLARVVARVSIPYMLQYVTLDALLPVLRARVPELGGYPQRVAVALYLSGDQSAAVKFVEDKRAEYASDEEVVRTSFDRFAVPFLSRHRN